MTICRFVLVISLALLGVSRTSAKPLPGSILDLDNVLGIFDENTEAYSPPLAPPSPVVAASPVQPKPVQTQTVPAVAQTGTSAASPAATAIQVAPAGTSTAVLPAGSTANIQKANAFMTEKEEEDDDEMEEEETK